MKPTLTLFLALFFVSHLLAAVSSPAMPDKNDSPAEKQRKLLAVLKSKGAPADKAICCKQLAIYGTGEAVADLAPLLKDPDLASWARIALEAIPDPAADAALRKAAGQLHGRLLVGVINSIAVRRDPQAVSRLLRKLKDKDVEVASASAIALGRIGGPKATAGLERALARSNTAVRPAVAQGCILSAERFLADGKAADAIRIYDLVRNADVPQQRHLEAIRGAILARGSDGLPLLVEQLRSSDPAIVGIGLHTARELPGRAVTEALAAEIQRASSERQAFLLLALGDRKDEAVMPALLAAAGSGPAKLRLTAVKILDRLGEPSSLPALLNAAADPDKELVSAALAACARLPGSEVDNEVVSQLPKSAGKNRQVLIQVAGQRQIQPALPLIVQSLEDSDAAVRLAAVEALNIYGGEHQAAELVRVLPKVKDNTERDAMETALIAISGRSGAASVPHLLELAHNENSALRLIGLHALASAGGSDALAAVKSAVDDKDEAVQDEAVRTLSTWPNNWPDDTAVGDVLLDLAKSGKKPAHQALGLRGYLQYVRGDKDLKNEDKVAKVNALLPLLKEPDQKRMAIAAVSAIPTAPVLDLLVNFAAEPDITEDASSALITLADKDHKGLSKEQRQKALQTVIDRTKSDATKKKAEEMLKTL